MLIQFLKKMEELQILDVNVRKIIIKQLKDAGHVIKQFQIVETALLVEKNHTPNLQTII